MLLATLFHEVNNAAAQLSYGHRLVVAGELTLAIKRQTEHHSLDNLGWLMVVGGDGRQLASESLVGVHRRGDKKQYQQHERNVSR